MISADDVVESAKKYSPFRASWWVALIQGVLAAGLGLLFWLNPVGATNALAQFLALYLLIHGLFEVTNSLRQPPTTTEGKVAYYRGILGALVGGILLSLLFLNLLSRDLGILVLGITLAIYGVVGIYLSFAVQRGNGRLLGIIGSVVLLLLGSAAFLGRNAESNILGTWIGPALVVIGVLLVVVAFVRLSNEKAAGEEAEANKEAKVVAE